MAFFNLTKLGVQDPIRNSLKESQPQRHVEQNSGAMSGTNSSIAPNMSSQAHGSHAIYTQRLTKHQRPNQAPNEIYRKPITASQEHGWWMEKKTDATDNNLSWTKIDRHVRVNSEMTRFVDEMTLTNKHFSLF